MSDLRESMEALLETAELPKKIGAYATFQARGKTLRVKKSKAGSYMLAVTGMKSSRWGNSKEAKSDIKHFMSTGQLPRSTEKSWS